MPHETGRAKKSGAKRPRFGSVKAPKCNSVPGATEAYVVVDIQRRDCEPGRHAHVVCIVYPAPAAYNAILQRPGRPLRVVRRARAVIRSIKKVVHPLRDVARHVVKAVAVCGVVADRRCVVVPCVHGGVVIGVRAAYGVAPRP